ncbi:MAG: hypothetical protein E7642_02155 [Ruminococcaceae bacterium]|nr:hypothetical protein [Oscillospiraceae bacterium]
MIQNNSLNTLRDNLALLNKRKEINTEQYLLTLTSMAKAVCEDLQYNELSEICDAYRSAVGRDSYVEKKALYETILKTPRLWEEVKGLLTIGNNDYAKTDTNKKIAYLKNNFNDVAYEKLSVNLHNARPMFVDSPEGACEAVANGIAQACILPIEDLRGGKLFGFYRLLDRFDLKITNVCSIDSEDDISNIKYALISKKCQDPWELDLPKKNYVFEFSTLSTNADFIEDLMSFARSCDALPITIDSKPIQYDPQLKRYIFSFLLRSSYEFLMYPPLVLTGYSPIGFYPNEF